jgi:hypothetical protein
VEEESNGSATAGNSSASFPLLTLYTRLGSRLFDLPLSPLALSFGLKKELLHIYFFSDGDAACYLDLSLFE